MTLRLHRGFATACAAALLLSVAAVGAGAQPLADHSIEVAGETLHFTIRGFPPNAQHVEPDTPLEPTSALNTAKLLNRFMTAGRLEDAALLSNAPRRRFEVLREYRQAVGEEGFRQVYTEYFLPENRLVAEVTMAGHSLLVWHLKSRDRYAGQYYVRVEGKMLMDDTPGETRTQLARLLDAIRSGKLAIPISLQ